MKQFFYAHYLQLVSFFKTTLLWWLMILGTSLLIVSHFSLFQLSKEWNGLLMSIGNAMLIGGVFSALLKSFQFMGLFHEEIGKALKDHLPGILDKEQALALSESYIELVRHEQIYRINQFFENKKNCFYFTNQDVDGIYNSITQNYKRSVSGAANKLTIFKLPGGINFKEFVNQLNRKPVEDAKQIIHNILKEEFERTKINKESLKSRIISEINNANEIGHRILIQSLIALYIK